MVRASGQSAPGRSRPSAGPSGTAGFAAVFDLEQGVLVLKGASLLLFQIESKTEAGGINPTLAELEQAPCNLVPRQGICDLRQARGVGDSSKAVVLLEEADYG